jgi:rfaE bifunctional protein nucleotidyltransferase chain/domain
MIITDNLIEPIINSFKTKNKKIVLAGGCFDVLHDAHLKFIINAKKEGDFLILLLESDENIKKLKGKGRPVNNFIKRANTLEGLGFIDLIVELSANVSDKYYYNLTKLIQPDIIALTKDDPLTLKKNEQAKEVGGETRIIMERDESQSSTKLINKK